MMCEHLIPTELRNQTDWKVKRRFFQTENTPKRRKVCVRLYTYKNTHTERPHDIRVVK